MSNFFLLCRFVSFTRSLIYLTSSSVFFARCGSLPVSLRLMCFEFEWGIDSVLFGLILFYFSFSVSHSRSLSFSFGWRCCCLLLLLLLLLDSCVWLHQTRRCVSSSPYGDFMHVYWLRKHYTYIDTSREIYTMVLSKSYCVLLIYYKHTMDSKLNVYKGGFWIQITENKGIDRDNNRVFSELSLI